MPDSFTSLTFQPLDSELHTPSIPCAAGDDLNAPYRQLAEHLPAAIYICDAEGRIKQYNDAAAELWGRAPVLGEDCWCGSWRIYHPDGSPMALDTCPMAQALKSDHAARGCEIIIERPDGSRRNVLPFPSAIRNPAGRIVGAVNMLIDITERKHVEAALTEARDAAEAANRAKDRFLAVLSHELRTPLTPVLMAVSAREMEADLPQGLREEIAMIRRNVELEIKLIDDLLDLSRITSGKLRLQSQPVNLNDAVRHVCEICQNQIQEKGIRLRASFDASVDEVQADPARLQQVLWNVLKNAAKFSRENGEIEVATRRLRDDRVAISVLDHGAGISPQLLPRIFDAFEQGDPRVARQFGGLGLGLAISKTIVELHGGTIRADSAGPGTGACFTIELPAAVPQAHTPARHAVSSGSAAPLRLLVVEDHCDTASLLRKLLGASGFVVKTAHNAADALKLAGEETFDLLISDIGLPDSTGYELMRQLRASHAMRGIAMSGYGMDDDLRRSREAGFADHLVKPIDLGQLQDAIRRLAPAR